MPELSSDRATRIVVLMLPYPLRLRSGVIFATLPGLLLVGFWSAAVTYVHLYHYNLQVDEGLVSLLGLVTAIAIAFKLCAGYHRYQDARTQWTRLTICIRNLARLIWFNVPDGPRAPLQQSHACSAKSGPWPPPTQMQVERKLREDLLCKASAIRLLVGFAVALKRHVRGEYGTEWPDVRSRVGYLPTLARRGPQTQISVSQTLYTTMDPEKGLPAIPPPTSTSWPRSLFSTPPPHPPPHPQPAVIPSNTAITQHNLPLEILGFLGSYAGYLACERKLSGSGGLSGAVQRELATLGDILGRCEALLEEGSMPLPYTVIIAQIKWLFLLLLPFQLLQAMNWLTIPAAVILAFTLLGLSSAAASLATPFSASDATALPLDIACTTLAIEIDALTSSPLAHQPLVTAHSSYYTAAAEAEDVEPKYSEKPKPANTCTGTGGAAGGECGSSVPAWMYLKGNRPLGPLVKKDFAECVRSLSVGDILEVMKMKGEMPEG
ncbi:hypothetical protein Dda_1921 [Drechslerella dactyloides]|uniref:Uncharacterized protein n=1 Tax=Drechslerella dactyloides TaxID=74499 RepID=A0AAD6J2S8_DREDA|nr:hypothetical protein Dda_1921 [Drechslerella dactyloides]